MFAVIFFSLLSTSVVFSYPYNFTSEEILSKHFTKYHNVIIMKLFLDHFEQQAHQNVELFHAIATINENEDDIRRTNFLNRDDFTRRLRELKSILREKELIIEELELMEKECLFLLQQQGNQQSTQP
jgi:hypothetical protein